MARRFKNFKRSLKLIRNLAAPNTPVVPPAGSALAKYQEFANGTTVITVNRPTDSLPQEILEVAINPFGSILDPTSEVNVGFSKRVGDASPLDPVVTACNHLAITGTAFRPRGFIPAKVVVRIAGTTSTPKTSAISGLTYTSDQSKSYTIPYGQKTGSTIESVVRAEILATAADTMALSFSSEKL